MSEQEKVFVTGLTREPGYLYMIGKDCHVYRSSLTQPGAEPELVIKTDIGQREPGYLYFIDKEGDISRNAAGGGLSSRRKRAAKKAPAQMKVPTPSPEATTVELPELGRSLSLEGGADVSGMAFQEHLLETLGSGERRDEEVEAEIDARQKQTAFRFALQDFLGACPTAAFVDGPNTPPHHVEHAQAGATLGRWQLFQLEIELDQGATWPLLLVYNIGDGDCNDGFWGAFYDRTTHEVFAHIKSTGDCETTIDASDAAQDAFVADVGDDSWIPQSRHFRSVQAHHIVSSH
jgi:hypothetical protein